MHQILMILAVLFVLGGFVGMFLGMIPTIVLWVLAAVCMIAAWKLRPASQRRREDELQGRHGAA